MEGLALAYMGAGIGLGLAVIGAGLGIHAAQFSVQPRNELASRWASEGFTPNRDRRIRSWSNLHPADEPSLDCIRVLNHPVDQHGS